MIEQIEKLLEEIKSITASDLTKSRLLNIVLFLPGEDVIKTEIVTNLIHFLLN